MPARNVVTLALSALYLLSGEAEAYSMASLTSARTLVVAPAPAISRVDTILMGRGDKRTKKGKRKAKSFGNCRPRNGDIRRAREGPGADLGVAREAVILEEPGA